MDFEDLKIFKSWEQVKPYFTNPSLITVEALFILLTLCNVYVVHTLFVTVLPAPVFITWWQLTQGLLSAYILGDFGQMYPKMAYFPSVKIELGLLKTLVLPTIAYVAMLCSTNIMLCKAPSTAAFPILASGAVAAHHAARFIACGEEYMPMRWKAIGFLVLAFVLGATDKHIAPGNIMTVALLYAFLAAVFRAGFMERALHIVGGRGNALHNHQHLIGAMILPVVWIVNGELKVLIRDLPWDITAAKTWQVWGCFVAVGALPFVKNVVSNRLIRQTGQAPWRMLELIAVALLFIIGSCKQAPSWQVVLATIFVIIGRFLGAVDVIRNLQYAREPGTSMGHQASEPFLQKDEAALVQEMEA
ncbi:GDP-fucose transporter 1 [Babesia bigemina]|uniref:GDP-fucose transporter 1 n=1 Tax=Babesia bigemina TaxID=5866 RepID=A0A061D3K6_BABBI|nr:GDP-fucose transporter 1 [Babesia bigemina]CDR95168.1 GDP-fucose transporter 1 [Babesia bigemina]|eukprot:XP_012767354.1 GDP-fucose transporter 1 [Babesia bigemina]